jgi:glycerol-3-phosphate dehydrogenase (NAD(P)+)
MPGDATPKHLSVLGAGAWGTTLALLLANNGHQVRLWTRDADHADALNRERVNARHLPAAPLPPNLHASADLVALCASAEALFYAAPVRASQGILAAIPPRHAPTHAFVLCSKGFVDAALTPLSHQVRQRFPGARVAVLAGPNLAGEIAAGKPTAATVAADATSGDFAATVQQWLHQPNFRIYPSSDTIGVELGGAIKNVIALAAGMADALALGENAKATLVTRGLAEMVRLGLSMGAKPETLYGLAGLGDLIATCAGSGSRNHQAGARLVAGERLSDLQADHLTAEGLYTVAHAVDYAAVHGLDLPLLQAVHAVVYRGSPPHEVLAGLLTRPAQRA